MNSVKRVQKTGRNVRRLRHVLECRDGGLLAIPSLKTLSRTSEKRLINVTDTYFPGELERECKNYLVREMSPRKVLKKPTWISKSGTFSLVTTIDQYSRKSQPINYKIIKELRPVPQK